MMRFYNYLTAALLKEFYQWRLWGPVWVGVGIVIYFNLPAEPSRALIYSICLAACAVMLWSKRREHLLTMLVSGIILCITLGMTAAAWRVQLVRAPTLLAPLKEVWVEGTISELIPQAQGYKIILRDLWVESLAPEQLPQALRITVRTKCEQNKAACSFQVGMRVEMVANLSPPPRAVIPGGYDFAFNAYFQQIGGVGFTIAPVRVLTQINSGPQALLANLRQRIYNNILTVLGSGSGHIASALMIGEYHALPKVILEDMRVAGLTHILSVSGMHLTLVAGLFFFVTRALLALSVGATLYWPIKKIAAISAILGSLFYLCISGMQIAALRSFMMSFIVLFGIILDQTSSTLRAVAVAALILLLWMPENIFHPSFQMSFAAVTALISLYPLWHRRWHKWVGVDPSWGMKIAGYIAGIMMSSLIAGTATTPFAIYHFNQYAGYGMLANMLAIPLTSFYIMPLVVIAFLALPLGLAKPVLLMLGWGIQQLINIAAWVSHLPESSMLLPSIPESAFVLLIAAGLWGVLWQERWRIAALPGIALAIMLTQFGARPLMLIDARSHNYAIKDSEGQWVLSSRRFSSFTRGVWLRANAQARSLTAKELTDTQVLQCNAAYCLYNVPGQEQHKIALLRSNSCPLPVADMWIALGANVTSCGEQASSFIDYLALQKMQSIAIYAVENKLTIKAGNPLEAKRAWQK